MVALMAVSYGVVRCILNNFIERAHVRAQVIENAINSSIADANQVMYGLVMMLTQEAITEENNDVSILLKNFDSNLSRYKSIPFSCFRLLSPDGTVVALTSVDKSVFTTQANTNDSELVSRAKENPFELQVGPIRISKRIKEKILPMCLAFNDVKGDYAGTLCSGLLVDKVEDKLNLDYSSENVVKITLLNKNDQRRPEHYSADNAFTISNLSALFEHVNMNEHMVLYKPLSRHPVLIEVEAKLDRIVKEIVIMMLLCFSYFLLFFVSFYGLSCLYKRIYRAPLCLLHRRIYAMAGTMVDLKIDVLRTEGLLKVLDDIAERLNLSLVKSIHDANAYTSMGLHNDVMDLILTEHHYDIPSKGAKTIFSNLYLTQLKKLVHEERRNINLADLLNEIKKQIHDLTIDIVVQQNDRKDFNAYYTALAEAILHIFALISQTVGHHVDKNSVVLKGVFTGKSLLPSIAIEISLSAAFGKNSSMETALHLGDCSGLLGIYLLAKENNLFFYVEQKGKKIIFSLEPISDERLDMINSNLSLRKKK